ncbi:MAG: cytochrome c [Nitrospirota bacterium]
MVFPSVQIPPKIAKGREIYNFRCYICHAYAGDGKTLAANVLAPRPRNFTDPAEMKGIDNRRMFLSIKNGRQGTAMESFREILTDEEIESVVAFIRYAFIEKKFKNINYHSPENQWYDFEKKYPEAIKYFLYEGDEDHLTEELKAGKGIFESTCITCHLVKKEMGGAIFRKAM